MTQTKWMVVALFVLKVLHKAIALANQQWPQNTVISALRGMFDDLLPNVSFPQTRAALTRVKLKKPPVALAVIAMAFLLGTQACATVQPPVLSYGASVPLLEFVPGQANPVQFAPGAGVMGSVGLFQVPIQGKQFDLLDVGASFFGNAVTANNGSPAGAAQAALTVGTLNNLLMFGIATPLFGGPNGGDFNGNFALYPMLGINIPINFGGPTSPPTGTAPGVEGFQRGGTLYVP